jgi:hypothetical protein
LGVLAAGFGAVDRRELLGGIGAETAEQGSCQVVSAVRMHSTTRFI